jgi:hypothetical protein
MRLESSAAEIIATSSDPRRVMTTTMVFSNLIEELGQAGSGICIRNLNRHLDLLVEEHVHGSCTYIPDFRQARIWEISPLLWTANAKLTQKAL